MRKKQITEDRIFDFIVYSTSFLILCIVLYPMYYVLIASFSDPVYVNSGDVFLVPKGLTMSGYVKMFGYKLIWSGYLNTIKYTVLGTTINVVLTIMAAYPLSRPEFYGRKLFMFIFAFTMFFNGGLIPMFLLVKNLGFLNTVWAIVLPEALSVYNMILARTYFKSTIPDELVDAGRLDGCNNTRFLISVALPLSMPIIAVLTLYYAVGYWNQYFTAMIYLDKEGLFPLQLILRSILVELDVNMEMMANAEDFYEKQKVADLIRYGSIVIAILPMLVLYPFLQKYFVKGVMIGSLKG